MFRSFLLLLIVVDLLHSEPIANQLSRLFIIGFEGKTVPAKLCDYLSHHPLGGVILFSKNISSPKQLRSLTANLRKCAKYPLLIGVDEEGGLVQRLSRKNGFDSFPKPSEVAKVSISEAGAIYRKMAKMLHQNGINLNFAPSVDLAINPKNKIIVGYGRSFGSDPQKVIAYGSIFVKAMQEEGVIPVLKHFPGHGSSHGDSHKGFVDVTQSWKQEELEPFLKIKAPMIMSAHIYNARLDCKEIATLSKPTLNLLRKGGFRGVIVSDDMQMGAIRKRYKFQDALAKSLMSGVDMLLVGNQLSHPISIDALVAMLQASYKKGDLTLARIKEANGKIAKLKATIKE